ncbi:Scarecrow-like protein 9 [Capsicum chinense]|nr:Scarecrow-like protein 9 [Capsicum chinense]
MTIGATSYKTTFGLEENDEEQAVEGDDGDVSKEDVEEEVVVKKEQNYVVGHEENVRVGENEISCGLIDGAKLDEHLVHVEERLEKMEAHSEKMVTLENKSQNPMTNYVLPSAASSCQNVHGTEMAMEATSYKINSGPEDDEEQAAEEEAEEDAGDMSKEDFVEEVVVKKAQNYVVGHEENVTVGENEISCGLSVGAKLDERLVQVEERLEKMETLLVDINEKLNCLVKMQDAKGSMDLRRPAKYMSSLWIGNGRSKRKHRVAELIRQSCKHRRLGRGDKAVGHPVALHDDCVENDQRKSTNDLLKQMREHSSPFGYGNQRLAHCFADGLEVALAGIGSQIYKALVNKRTVTSGTSIWHDKLLLYCLELCDM